MATRRETLTLALAGLGAMSGLTSLSAIVWEKVKYRSRVEMELMSFERIPVPRPAGYDARLVGPPNPRFPELVAWIDYTNYGKFKTYVDACPLLKLHHPDGRRFGPYLMLPSYKGGWVSLEPLGTAAADYFLRGLRWAIDAEQIPDIRSRFDEFTFEISAKVQEQDINSRNPWAMVVTSFPGHQVRHNLAFQRVLSR